MGAIDILILVLAIPTGYLIARMASDELVAGRKWFKILFILGTVLGLFFWFYGIRHAALTCLFIAIASLVSLIKGNDKNLTKRKI